MLLCLPYQYIFFHTLDGSLQYLFIHFSGTLLIFLQPSTDSVVNRSSRLGQHRLSGRRNLPGGWRPSDVHASSASSLFSHELRHAATCDPGGFGWSSLVKLLQWAPHISRL
eukprot:g78957.t1